MKTSYYCKAWVRGVLFSFLIPVITGCGSFSIGIGGGVTTGDVRPSGNPVKQAQFLSSSQVAGSALVFYSNGAYILRLEGMTFPSVPGGLQARLYFSPPPGGSQAFTLQSTFPNQNYTISSTNAGVTFISVSIISAQNTNVTYGTALFQ